MPGIEIGSKESASITAAPRIRCDTTIQADKKPNIPVNIAVTVAKETLVNNAERASVCESISPEKCLNVRLSQANPPETVAENAVPNIANKGIPTAKKAVNVNIPTTVPTPAT